MDGTLLIPNLIPEDAGNYTCIPTNGILAPPSASAHLKVKRKSLISRERHHLFLHPFISYNSKSGQGLSFSRNAQCKTLYFTSSSSDPARVGRMSRETYLPAGMEGVLVCPVQADPPVLYVNWTKDGNELNLDNVSYVANTNK